MKLLHQLGWSGFLGLAVAGLVIAGCRAPEAPPAAETEASPTTAVSPVPAAAAIPDTEIKATQPWRLVFAVKDRRDASTGTIVDPNWERAWQGAQQAAEDFGVEVMLLPNACQTCVEDQIRAINELIERDTTDGLVLGAVDSLALVPVVEKAIAAGIPVIAVDTPLNSDRLVTTVGFDNFAAGRVLGEWIAAQLPSRSQVAILNGPLDHQNALERRDGFLAGMQKNNLDIVATASADWGTEPAVKIAAEWFAQHPDLKAIVAANDRMALGAAQAAAAAGRSDVLIAGFDALDIALEAIAAGQLAATIDQRSDLQARLALQLLIRHLENQERFPSFSALPEIPLVTRENVATYR